MSKVFRRVMVAAVLAGIAAVMGAACGPQPAPPAPGGTAPPANPSQGNGPGSGDDADRPPIIVTGGSVHLRVVSKNRGLGSNESRGAWKTNADGYFYHYHGGPKARRLMVSLLYASELNSNNSYGCAKEEQNYDVREVVITYGPLIGPSKTFTIKLDTPGAGDEGDLITDLKGADAKVDDKIGFWLDVGGALVHPQQVSFPSLSITCKLDGTKGQVQIYQSTKK